MPHNLNGILVSPYTQGAATKRILKEREDLIGVGEPPHDEGENYHGLRERIPLRKRIFG